MGIPYEKQQQALRLENYNEHTSIKLRCNETVEDAVAFIEKVRQINRNIECHISRKKDTAYFKFTGSGSDLAKIIYLFYERESWQHLKEKNTK